MDRLRAAAPIPGYWQRVAVRAILAAHAGDADTARADAAEIDGYSDDTDFTDWVLHRLATRSPRG